MATVPATATASRTTAARAIPDIRRTATRRLYIGHLAVRRMAVRRTATPATVTPATDTATATAVDTVEGMVATRTGIADHGIDLQCTR